MKVVARLRVNWHARMAEYAKGDAYSRGDVTEAEMIEMEDESFLKVVVCK